MEILNNYIQVELIPEKSGTVQLLKPQTTYAKVRVVQGVPDFEAGTVLLVSNRANIIPMDGKQFITDEDVMAVLENDQVEIG